MFTRLDSLDDLRSIQGPLHLAMGVFDGVHTGHQAVIGEAVRSARENGGRSFVVTFFPHPIRVIAPEKAPSTLLATIDAKAEVVRSLGADGVVVVRFDEKFAQTEAAQFVRMACAAEVRSISVGEDWRFGNKRTGDVNMLARMGEELGFQLQSVRSVMWDGERVSSTRIRQAIRDGNFDAVEEMLGRPYEVSGLVIEGRKLGREIGFPTANLRLGDLQTPKNGVWAVEVNGNLKGVANLGVRPTLNDSEKLLEVHIFDFSEEIYGTELRVRFRQFLRPEMKFDSLEELRRQIEADAESARKILG